VVKAVPFIGDIVKVGIAIPAVGKKVTPKLKEKYSDVGKWLQEILGKEYIEQLLEILWKDPRRAEFLYLEAFLEDINNRKDGDRPILFTMDHFEYVESEKTKWQYGGKQIAENELWCAFLRSLSNCVSIMAGRKPIAGQTKAEVEESELIELDRESCIELLERRHVSDTELQDRIVSVSGGNPFLIGAICDLAETGGFSLEDVEDLRSDTLEAVRLKTWRRLFSQSEALYELVEKASLVPFFDRQIMSVIDPSIRTDQWDKLIRLSFVRNREDKTWVLHDLAKDLIIAELDQRLQAYTDEVATVLEESSTDTSDYTLLGLAMSVRALASESDAEARVASIICDLVWNYAYSDALSFLDAVTIDTREGHAILEGLRGGVLIWLNRFADGEHSLLKALEAFEGFGENIPNELMLHKAQVLRDYGSLPLIFKEPQRQ
jgi:hypothetical protein